MARRKRPQPAAAPTSAARPAPPVVAATTTLLPRGPVALVIVVALAFRAFYLALYHGSAFYRAPVVDASTFRLWAEALHAGRPFMPGVYFKPPLYPWILSMLMGVVGQALTPVYVLQALVGTGSCVLVLILGRRFLEARAALVAALVCAVLPILVFLEFQLLAEVWTTALMLLALVLLPAAGQRSGRSLLVGLVLGIAALGRPNLLLLPVVLAGWSWLADPARRRRPAVLLLVGAAVAISPATLHNLGQGHFVLVSANAGANLWAGIRPGADGTSAIPIGIQWDDLQRQSEQAGARDAADASRYLIGRSLREAAQHPLRALGLLGRKALLLVNAHEGRNNIGPTYLAREDGVVVLERWWPGFWLMMPLAGLGLLALARPRWFTTSRPRGVAPLLLVMAALAVSVLPFFVNARFRQPLLPLLALFCGWGVVVLARALRSGWIAALRAVVVVLAIGVVVNVDWFGVAARETGARDELNLAGILARGTDDTPPDLQAALAHFQAAARLDPTDPDVPEREGLMRQGAALDLLQRADQPGQPPAAAARMRDVAIDQLRQAAALHQRAIQLFPDSFRSYGSEGSALGPLARSSRPAHRRPWLPATPRPPVGRPCRRPRIWKPPPGRGARRCDSCPRCPRGGLPSMHAWRPCRSCRTWIPPSPRPRLASADKSGLKRCIFGAMP